MATQIGPVFWGGQMGSWGEDRNHESFAKTQGTGGGNAQMPEQWRPSATDGSAIRGAQGLRWTVALPGDALYVTGVEPRAVTNVATS